MARKACASSGVRLPMVEPGKYTAQPPRLPFTGSVSGREKSPTTGTISSRGNSRARRRAAARGEARDGGDMCARQRQLGPRQVILAQPADALEQAAACRVVEVLGGKALAGQRKPRDDVFAKAAA